MKDLKNQFMQTAFLTNIWVLGIIYLFMPSFELSVAGAWRIIGIAVIVAFVFGVCYPYVWQYTTWAAPVNIVITTGLNFIAGFIAVYLFSVEMFNYIRPYWWIMLILNTILHIISFYFYRKYQNKKIADSLNQITK